MSKVALNEETFRAWLAASDSAWLGDSAWPPEAFPPDPPDPQAARLRAAMAHTAAGRPK